MLSRGTKVCATQEAIQQRVFGMVHRGIPFDPGEGVVVSTSAPLRGCVIAEFSSGERMTHADWLEPVVIVHR